MCFYGDEIFLVNGAVPTEVYNHRLDVNNSDGILSAHMSISEKLITFLDKQILPCKTYDSAKGKYEVFFVTVEFCVPMREGRGGGHSG